MKRILKFSLIIVLLIGLVLFLSKIFISNLVEDRIAKLINNNKSVQYVTSVGNVKFKLLDRSITLNNIFIGLRSDSSLDSLMLNTENNSI